MNFYIQILSINEEVNRFFFIGRKAHVRIQTLSDSIKKVLRTEEELENILISSEENENTYDDVPAQDNSNPITNSEEEINIKQDVDVNVNICCICKKESSGLDSCCKYGQTIHTICADNTLDTGEDFGSTVVCIRCAQKELITMNKEKTIDGLRAQANTRK